MFVVVRRHAKVAADRRMGAGTANEPVAGTSQGTTKQTDTGTKSSEKNEKDKRSVSKSGVTEVKPKEQSQVMDGQKEQSQVGDG